MQEGRFVQLLFILSCIFLVIFPGDKAFAHKLTDIPSQYATGINYLIQQGIITGYPDNTFRPKNNVTRGEAATMIGKALGVDGENRNTSFSDVPKKYFASGYIESLYQRKIIAGVGNGKFEPNRPITRGEMAVLISKAFSLQEMSHVFYLDVIQTHPYYTGINKVSTAGIAVGYPGGTYKPKSYIKRDEFAVMVSRAVNPAFQKKITQEIKTKYTTANLNIRKGPGVNYDRLTTLSMGTKVTVYWTAGNWAYVSAADLKGYVSTEYLSDDNQATPPPKKPDKKMIVTVDPGHGGRDPGASANGIIEKDLNLFVGLKVREYLEREGFQVVMTRSDDTFIELEERVKIAEKNNSDIFVSIHGNAATSEARGSESYYYAASLNQRSQDSQQLATFIQKRLVEALGTRDRGVKHGNFHVIRETSMPAALVELGFITNKDDAAILKTHRQAAAKAISQGIIDYYHWKYK